VCLRNGRSTKIHALVEGKPRPIPFVLTGGHCMTTQVAGQFLQALLPPGRGRGQGL